MAKGFSAAKKAAPSGGGSGFEKRPPGINYFTLKNGQTANVRILTSHEDIQWMPKWQTAPSGNFKYGELINKIDVDEDGTPDPGYAANLKTGWKCYIHLIWRNAPAYQKGPDGKLAKDGLGNKILAGYADQVCVWETSFTNYDMLREKEAKFRSIGAFDWEIKRIGADKETKYTIEPSDPMNLNVPLTPQDYALVQANPIDIEAIFCKKPNFDELQAYLNPGQKAPAVSFVEQTQLNANPTAGPNPFLS